MALAAESAISRGKWMALLAAFLGWMFDGLEMGLFPLVARPALRELLSVNDESLVGLWFAVATAGFLVGAATGGVLFGWLGDRIGRVRAMMLSVLTYACFTGLCGLATSAEQIAVFRFISALGMGGEWSLGVALVMEIWPDRSRAWLAGAIGAAANFGFLLIAVFGAALAEFLGEMDSVLRSLGLPGGWVDALLANSGWRFLLLLGAAPAVLTFFIRFFVPESRRWEHEKGRGATSHWAGRDLFAVLIGAGGAIFVIYLWAAEQTDLFGWTIQHDANLRIGGSLIGIAIVTLGYVFPVLRYIQRSGATAVDEFTWPRVIGRMLLGACLGGVALLGTWASIQWAPLWADQLTGGQVPTAKAYTQIASAVGAIVGTLLAPQLGNVLGRRVTYSLLCLGSLLSALAFFQLNSSYGALFLISVLIAGGMTASFYGWLPLYLPELFPTRVRATGQGFSFNFGRIIAAVGVLQTSNLMHLFSEDVVIAGANFSGGYPLACSVMSLIYLVGIAIVWLAPETKGKPLPE